MIIRDANSWYRIYVNIYIPTRNDEDYSLSVLIDLYDPFQADDINRFKRIYELNQMEN